jgi:uncharacterized protein YdhG (YjbR/CyaY superfamily)
MNYNQEKHEDWKGKIMYKQNSAVNTFDEYIAGFPEDVQQILGQIRAVIREAAPGAVEKISYQMPTFFLNGNLVHFAAFKNHIGFYPTPGGIEAFKDEIAHYKWAKGSVQFSLDEPMPYDLMRRITLFRVAENSRKK